MIILGIHDGHNASAAISVDGKPVALMGEERCTYKKNDMGFPLKAIEACLQIAGLKASDIDQVAFSTTNLPLHYMRIKREYAFTVRDWLDEQEKYWKPYIYENKTNLDYISSLQVQDRFKEEQIYSFDDIPTDLTPQENRTHLERLRAQTIKRYLGLPAERIVSFDHHTCHAHYAYFASPFRGKKTLVFTSDGGGDGTNGTLSVAENDSIKEIARNNTSDLGRIYRYVTLLLGMKIGEHEYKVMGLAPYCSDYELKKTWPVFADLFHVPNLMIEYKNRPRDLFFHFREALADKRFDGISGAVQKMVEVYGTEWIDTACKKLEVDRVVFSGGLSMNVKLNKTVTELDSVKEFYCPASGGDESLALGACYVAHKAYEPHLTIGDISNNYLGTTVDRDEALRKARELPNADVKAGVTNEEIAQLLADNLVVGRCAGKMEFGARALGNRSILANPSNTENVRKINQQIKFRDFWMPFAPSVLDSFAPRYLHNPKNIGGDHMTHTYDVTPEGRQHMIAALHPFDYTARAHIVTEKNNPGYHHLIKRFSEKTGVGVLLNTSFNLHGFPIVSNVDQCLHVFSNSNIDAIVIEDVLVRRRRT